MDYIYRSLPQTIPPIMLSNPRPATANGEPVLGMGTVDGSEEYDGWYCCGCWFVVFEKGSGFGFDVGGLGFRKRVPIPVLATYPIVPGKFAYIKPACCMILYPL